MEVKEVNVVNESEMEEVQEVGMSEWNKERICQFLDSRSA